MPTGEKDTRASLVNLITTAICMFKVNNCKVRTMCQISSGLALTLH